MLSCAVQKLVEATAQPNTSIANWHTPNKRFKRDSQRVAFLLCVGFCGYSVMRKVRSRVGCPLSGR
ncbi:DUF3265 domain-containing protein [Vibrio cholerae]|nr:DUF3265 domain-containing protein [Vibrio cholerae]